MSPRISIRLLTAQSDQRLVALVRQGHERAFEALVHRYRRPLLRYCQRMRLSDSRAEDVLQHALLQAWLALTGGAEVRDLKPWLYRIVHNAAVNAMRGSCEDHAELADAAHAQVSGATDVELDRRIAVRQALSDIAVLPQMQRQAMFLTAVDGQSHDEVASALGITHGAVRGLLYRARATLRSAAAAIMPQSLVGWASGGAGTVAPTAQKLADLSVGAGAAGTTGVLLKGALVAVMAGALATGTGLVHPRQHGPGRSNGQTSSAGVVRSTGHADSTGVPAFPTTSAPPTSASADRKGVRAQAGADVRRGARGLARARAPINTRLVGPAPAAFFPQRVAPRGVAPRGVAPQGVAPRGVAEHASPAGVTQTGGHDGTQGGTRTTAVFAGAAGGGGASSGSGDGGHRDAGGEEANSAGSSGEGSGFDGSGVGPSGSSRSRSGGGDASPSAGVESTQTVTAASAEPTNASGASKESGSGG